MGFFEDDGRKPTDDEIQALVVQINSYFKEELQRGDLKDDALEITVKYADLQYTEGASMPLDMHFEIQAVHGNGNPVPSNEVYVALKLDNSQLLDLLQNYVHKAAPTDTGANVFAKVNRVNFEAHSANGAKASTSKYLL